MKSGIDTSFIDPTIRVQDDLFRHFNGRWLTTHEIPADRSSDGVGYALHEQAERQVREIIEGSPATEEGRKIANLYQSFMNTARIEELGFQPIIRYLNAIEEIVSVEDFLRFLGALEID